MKNITLFFSILFALLITNTSYAQPDPPEGCIDVFAINPDVLCPSIYEPVCGCDNITYANACIAYNGFGITEWTEGECGTSTDCFEMEDVDFGDCEMLLGVGIIAGECQYISGCGYIVNNIDYSAYFYIDIEDCQSHCNGIDGCIDLTLINTDISCTQIYEPVCGCDGITYANTCEAVNFYGVTEWTEGECGTSIDCIDLGQLDFGECTMPLGIALINGSCTSISGCGYAIGNTDYSDYFFESFEECQQTCGDDQIDCFDFTDLDFGDCEMILGVGLINGQCQYISGCGYLIGNIDYSDYFYNELEACSESCNGVIGCVDENQIDLNILCTEEYNPVCGCDGVTYSNFCQAENYYGVTEWTFGECDANNDCINEDLINDIACDTDYTPVCGCDGVTYPNTCVAENWHGVSEWTLGECDGTNDCMDLAEIDFGICQAILGITNINGNCVLISGCGFIVNNIDYSGYFFETMEDCESECEDDPIDCYDFTELDFGDCYMVLGVGLINGQCQYISGCGYLIGDIDYTDYFYAEFETCLESCNGVNDCIDESLIDLNILCAEEYNPVCGCDEITYNNACEAENWHGVTEWTLGPCGDTIDCLDLGEIDFGICQTILGITLYNGACVNISGCGFIVDNVDYSGYFFDSIEDCLNNCETMECINEDQINLNTLCPTVALPVCGCNGITYNNACEAENWYGITEWVDGICSDTLECVDLIDVDFGDCDMVLGVGLINNECQVISGCGYIVDFVNYEFYFFDSMDSCNSQCVSTDNIEDFDYQNYTAYPNPTSGLLNIQFNSNLKKEIQLLNYQGQEVFTKETTNTVEQIDVQRYSKGMYLLKIGYSNGQHSIERILIK